MANAITITKNWPSKSRDLYIISAQIVINDGTKDVVTCSVSAKHNPVNDISVALALLEQKIKETWEEYKAMQAVFEAVDEVALKADVETYLNKEVA